MSAQSQGEAVPRTAGDDDHVGTAGTNFEGRWAITTINSPGTYYAKVSKDDIPAGTCKAARSKDFNASKRVKSFKTEVVLNKVNQNAKAKRGTWYFHGKYKSKKPACERERYVRGRARRHIDQQRRHR